MKDQQLIQLIIAPAARDDLVDIHEFGGRTWVQRTISAVSANTERAVSVFNPTSARRG
jgi:hypothetical protein